MIDEAQDFYMSIYTLVLHAISVDTRVGWGRASMVMAMCREIGCLSKSCTGLEQELPEVDWKQVDSRTKRK